jgi:DNA-binding SARP family transcriptional activator
MRPPTNTTSRTAAPGAAGQGRRTGPRAPRGNRRRGGSLGRRGAAAFLLLLVAVPPTLLLLLTGNPLDPPVALRGTSALQQQLDDATIVYLLAVAVWLVWLHLLGCLLTETLQQARGSRIRMPLPRLMFGANALLASHLMAALLMSGSHVSFTPAPSNAAVVTTQLAHPPTRAVLPADRSQLFSASPDDGLSGGTSVTPTPPGRTKAPITCRVLPPHGRHHDTLWDIAERHLGDGTRWRDIYALNEGRVMPDGQRLTRASLIRPGWILQLPTDATALPVDAVVATDTLDTAGRPAAADTRLATPRQAPAEASDETPGELPREDQLKAVPKGEPRTVPDPVGDVAEQPERASRPAPALSPLVHDEPAAPTAATPPPAATPHGASQAPAAVSTPSTSRGSTPAMSHETSNGERSITGPTGHDSVVAETAVGAGLLGLAGVGLVAALTRRRKVAARRRPPGTRPATPAPELLELEAQLRRDARSAQDIAAAVRLAALLCARHDPALELAAVWHHSDDSLELIPASTPGIVPSAPAPFLATDRGWLLPPEAQRFLFVTTRSRTVDMRLTEELEQSDDPFPLLLLAGQQDGSTCLVNLRHFHAVNLTRRTGAATDTGDVAARLHPSVPAVVAGWVQQLSGAPWAEFCQIVLAPAYAELATGLPNVAVAAPDDLARLTLAAPAHSDGVPPDGEELLVGFTRDQIPPALLTAPPHQTARVTLLFADADLDGCPDVSSWTLHDNGTVAIPGIADSLVPTPVDDERLALILRLLEHAQDPPQASATDPGVRARALDTPATPLPVTDPGDVTAASDEGLDDAAAAPADEAAAPTESASSSPSSDAPAEQEIASPVVRVDVLGPVMVTGTLATLGGTLRQILLYLALHRRAVQPRALWEAIWPDREFNDHSLRSRCNELKRYLHRQLLKDGRAWVLPETVRCDWQEFKALAAGDTGDKVTALALVRGRPFEDFAPDWVHLEGFASEVEATIVDLALEVATDALERGDTMTASVAAAAGVKASPYEERLVQLGIRAAQDRGAHSLARSLHRQLSVVLDEEIEPDDTELRATTQLMADLNYAESLHRYKARRASDT